MPTSVTSPDVDVAVGERRRREIARAVEANERQPVGLVFGDPLGMTERRHGDRFTAVDVARRGDERAVACNRRSPNRIPPAAASRRAAAHSDRESRRTHSRPRVATPLIVPSVAWS